MSLTSTSRIVIQPDGSLKSDVSLAELSTAVQDQLNLVPGTDIQAYDADLAAIAALAPSNDDFLQRKAGAWTNRTIAQARADLASGYVLAKSGVAVPHTGTTAATDLVTVTIPAGALGPNGQLLVDSIWSVPNNANTKTCRVKLGASNIMSSALTAVLSLVNTTRVANRNSASSQICGPIGISTSNGTSTTAVTTTSIDTSAAVDLKFSAQLGVDTDTITLESYLVRVIYGA